MEMVVLVGLVVGAVLVADHVAKRGQRLLPAARHEGRVRHLRTGEFSTTCSWCKSTALARRVLMFQRAPEGWRSVDVMAQLQTCPDAEVESVAYPLGQHHPQWRRLCSERCARELAGSEHVAIADTFVSCAYCTTRAPATLIKCPNCGAPRSDS